MITITTLNEVKVYRFVCSVADHLGLPDTTQRALAQRILCRIICKYHYSDHVICYPGWDIGRVAAVKAALTAANEPHDFYIIPSPNSLMEVDLEALNQNRLFYWCAPALANCKHRYINFLKWLYEQNLEEVTEVRYPLLQWQYANTLHSGYQQEEPSE